MPSCATDWTQQFEEHPENLKKFPEQVLVSIQSGANHMGDPPETEIDVTREFMPAGQGVGAIHELIPAGELVRRILSEAEIAMDAIQRVRR